MENILLSNILENYDGKPRFLGSCALVGNSGNLLDKEYGDFIDSHDFIIRCNEARTKDYEKYVGSRTDIRIVNCHMFEAALENTTMDLNRMKNLFSMFDKDFLYKIQNENIIVKDNINKQQFFNIIQKIQNENKNNVFFVDRSFYNSCFQMINNYPTTGFIGLMLALKYFNKINCFGFSFYEENTKKHYYEEVKPYDMSSHRFDMEKQIFKYYEENNKIKIL